MAVPSTMVKATVTGAIWDRLPHLSWDTRKMSGADASVSYATRFTMPLLLNGDLGAACLPLAAGAAITAGVLSWRIGRGQRASQGSGRWHKHRVVLCAADKEPDLEEAAKQLDALEAELEALEELEEAEAEMMRDVDNILAKAPAARSSSVTTSKGATAGELKRVFVCGVSGGVGAQLLERLSLEARIEPRWATLDDVRRRSFEDLDDILSDCNTLVVTPDITDSGADTLPLAKEALKALLASCPDSLSKIILLSSSDSRKDKGGFNIGSFFDKDGGSSLSDLEDELTSTARKRSGNRPLYPVIVRAGSPVDTSDAEVACWAGDGTDTATCSAPVAAEAIYQALSLQVDTGFSVSGGSIEGADWPELLLPFIGPEVWRREVPDATRAAFFVKGWAEEFFGSGKSALRMGVKTPVRFQETPSGVIFKFAPLGTAPGALFQELDDGGVEFLAEEPAGLPPRMRARRCAYGWKVTIKENSERALLEKFAADWERAFPN